MKKSLNAWKKIAARFVKNKKPSETLEMALIKAKHVQSLRSKRPLQSLRSLRSKRPLRKTNTNMQKKTRRMY